MRFRYAHAAHADGAEAVEQCLAQCAAQTDGFERRANLGFLYVTEPLLPRLDEILGTLKARTGVANWVGSSAVGVCATGVDYEDEPALALMLGRFPAGSANVFSGTQRPPTRGTRTDRGAPAAHTALVHADPDSPDLPGLLLDMAGKLDSEYLFGGVSSGRARSCQIADRPLQGGLSGVVFAADVGLSARVTQGVHPLPAARLRRVTAANGNAIASLDGLPPVLALLQDAGLIAPQAQSLPDAAEFAALLPRLREVSAGGLFAGVEPQTRRGAGVTIPGADYVARQLLALDPTSGNVVIAAAPEVGQTMRFCARNDAAARGDLIRVCTEIRTQLAHSAATATGAIYASCVGRGGHMFGDASEELRLIRDHLGDVPLVGFHAGGEIAGCNLYGFTGVLTVFFAPGEGVK